MQGMLICLEEHDGVAHTPKKMTIWKDTQCIFGGGGSVAKSGLTICDPMDCNPPDSFAHGIPQARILEGVAILFCRGFSWPRDRTWVSCMASGFLLT